MLGEHSPTHASHIPQATTTDCAHRRRLIFTGRVQGVGFRYTVKNIAMQHDVSGFVRNLPGGQVELVIEGPDGEVDQVLEALKCRMCDYIRKVDAHTMPATGEFEHQFSIRH